MDQLNKFATEIMQHGPNRVIINFEGEAVSSFRARNEYNINPDIIFIRKDGWSLGAPKIFANIAENLWKDEWIGFLEKPSTIPKPYGDSK